MVGAEPRAQRGSKERRGWARLRREQGGLRRVAHKERGRKRTLDIQRRLAAERAQRVCEAAVELAEPLDELPARTQARSQPQQLPLRRLHPCRASIFKYKGFVKHKCDGRAPTGQPCRGALAGREGRDVSG